MPWLSSLADMSAGFLAKLEQGGQAAKLSISRVVVYSTPFPT
jgi:hypothetical protein